MLNETFGTYSDCNGLKITSKLHTDGRVLVTQVSEAGTFNHVEDAAKWMERWDNIRDAGLIRVR